VNGRRTLSGARAFVFDFDGTLARLNIDFGLMKASVLELMDDFQIPPGELPKLPVLEMIAAAGGSLEQSHRGSSAPFFRRAYALLTEIELAAAEEGALLEGTHRLLTLLAQRTIGTGIITRNCRAAVLKVFPEIDRYCRIFLAREDTTHVKPHPEHLRAVLRALDVPPGQAAMVGDHPIDILLGRRTGTFTIGVLTGHSGAETLQQADADMILDKAYDIIDFYP
jgi:phosphoglycolate phosphatase